MFTQVNQVKVENNTLLQNIFIGGDNLLKAWYIDKHLNILKKTRRFQFLLLEVFEKLYARREFSSIQYVLT